MERQTELQLIDELLALKQEEQHFLDATVARNPIDLYLSEDRFAAEREKIFARTPMIAAHGSELASAGDFLRCDIAGRPVLLTRDKDGAVHAFLNVCRHRGTRLVDDMSGCKHRFSCPYHGWTYANTGELIAAPHFDSGFDGVDKSTLGLKQLPCVERFGFIWVSLEGTASIDASFAALAPELEALQMQDMVIAHQDTHTHKANWKIIVEGGIEAYHFKVAHKTTIGPYFEDNMSSYRMFGQHMRSILMRNSMSRLTPETRDSWRLRDHAQVLYTLFPTSSLLVQADHIAWIHSEPLSPDTTRIRLATLVPKAEADKTSHWQTNHMITKTTLDEDFAIGESIQANLASGANDTMLFGRFEGALDAFNQTVNAMLDDGLDDRFEDRFENKPV